MLYLKTRCSVPKYLVVTPIISSVIIPLIIMDIWMEVYHRTCFPLCGIPYIKRKNYIKVMDRAKLPYLNVRQKAFCMYCGYGNGLINYRAEIAGETEHYRCGIQHKKDKHFIPSDHEKDFAKYGDKDSFIQKYCQQ